MTLLLVALLIKKTFLTSLLYKIAPRSSSRKSKWPVKLDDLLKS